MARPMLVRLTEALCWVLAVLGGSGYIGGRALAEHERQAGLEAFATALAAAMSDARPAWRLTPDPASEATPSMPGILAVAPQPDTRDWSPPRAERYRRALGDPAAADAVPRAVLHIPRLGLQVPVYEDLSERNLNRGAALVGAEPAWTGNLAVAGHRDGWFRSLEQAQVGDLVEVQDLAARRRFRITRLSIVEPTDLSVLAPTTEPSLTLITCYPFRFVGSAPQRYIVRATAEP